MINYCLDYYHTKSGNYYTSLYYSESERCQFISYLKGKGGYRITNTYEDEECYCYAYSENECACGNFK